jgi:hypothetical protein
MRASLGVDYGVLKQGKSTTGGGNRRVSRGGYTGRTGGRVGVS